MQIPQDPTRANQQIVKAGPNNAGPGAETSELPVAGDQVDVSVKRTGVCPFGFGAAPAPQPAQAPAPEPPAIQVIAAPKPPASIASIEETGAAGPISASASWHDPAPTSAEQREAFVEQVRHLQNHLVEAGKVSEISRGFHQKQNWGGKATISFDAKMPEGLRKEAFANVAGHQFIGAVRFSNGQGCPHKDSKGDVRGMAIKMNIGGQEVDLLATNHVTFARDAAQFMRFADIAETMQADGNFAALHELVSKIGGGEFSGREAARIAGRLAHDVSKHTQHVAAETYWTQAVKVGDMVGRFAFIPESGADAKRGWFPHENYLRDGMEHDLSQHDVRMKIVFEAFTDDVVATDASVHGDHVTFPVGEVVFAKRGADTPERKAEEDLVSKMAFNPSHGVRMAGTMNESNRAAIYAESARNRGAFDWNAPEVQAFFK